MDGHDNIGIHRAKVFLLHHSRTANSLFIRFDLIKYRVLKGALLNISVLNKNSTLTNIHQVNSTVKAKMCFPYCLLRYSLMLSSLM